MRDSIMKIDSAWQSANFESAMQLREPIIMQFMIGTQAHALQVFNNAFRSSGWHLIVTNYATHLHKLQVCNGPRY